MTNLARRLSVSFVLVSISVSIIFFAPKWLFLATVEVFCGIGFAEFLGMCEKKSVRVMRPLAFGLALLLPLATYWGLDPFVLILACVLGLMVSFQRDRQAQAILSTSLMIFGLIYVVWFFSHVIKMRYVIHGAEWVFFTALLAKGGDAGAYFIGSKYGKRKLAESISPNKSVEGAVGGLATTVILSILSGIYLPHVSFFHRLILGVSVGILSQVGDLAESVMKREVGIKDSGTIPGLGGVLDVLDSLLLTYPLVYYYMVIFLQAAPLHGA